MHSDRHPVSPKLVEDPHGQTPSLQAALHPGKRKRRVAGLGALRRHGAHGRREASPSCAGCNRAAQSFGKAEADRGKRRRAQQREVTKQHDRDRRQRRRKEIMAAALEDDDDANASLDLAAARAHWHRLRKAHTAEVDEQAQAAMQADRARKADATREAGMRKQR